MKKFRTTHKKLLSLLLVMIMLVSIAPANLFSVTADAIDARVEQAVQTAVAIANDNSHGYSQSSRQGPDYDCSSLVYYAFSSAGFSFSPTWFNTTKMGSALINAGFVELTNIDLSNSNSLQRGDILWKEGHTEIYIGNNQLVGAHWHYGYTQQGDQPGNEISVGSYYYMSKVNDPNTAWTKVYRYVGSDTSKPTNVSVNNNFVHINWEACTDAEYYNVRIRRIVNGEEIADEYSLWSVKDLKAALALPEGKYRIYVEAKKKDGGNYKYNDANVTVVSKDPIISSTVKNGQVTLNWSDYTGEFHHYKLRVYVDKIWSSEYKVFDNLNTNLCVVNLSDGHYQAYVDVCDRNGNVITSGSVCDFDVSLVLTRTSVGNNIAFYSWTEHAGAEGYNLRAKKIDGDVWTESESSVWGITETSSTLELSEGKYYVYVDAITADGVCKYTDDIVTISYKDPKVSVDVTDSNVAFSWTKHENANHYRLRIYRNKIWTNHIITYDNITDLTYATTLDSGEYAALVEVMDSNDSVLYYGTAIKFTVNHQHSYEVLSEMEATCELDGERIYSCSCGDSYIVTTPAKGHNYREYIVAPTETEMGYTRYSCDCGSTYFDDYIPAIGKISIFGKVNTFSSTDIITFNFVNVEDNSVVYRFVIDGDSCEYFFRGMKDGEYTLKVSQENHTTNEFDVTISDETVNLDIQLNLIGDINGDGKINVMDYSSVLRHAKKTENLEDYAFLCADVDGNGRVTVSDYARILRHVKKTDPLW